VGLTLSGAQLQKIADHLFLIKSAADTKLPKPVNTDDLTNPDNLASRMAPIAADPDFTGFGIGVVDFTKDPRSPRVWLHKGDDSWRMGSTAKIAILLAAAQLREDVRQVKGTGLVSTPEDYNELFQMAKLWKLSKNAGNGYLGQIAAHPPRISTLFDFTKDPVDFIGPDPNNQNPTDIFNKLPVVDHEADGTEIRHLTWAEAPNFDCSERLWLTGARSDNVAATSCISEIGVAYLKAVQFAYGLFDPRKGMHLLLAGGYSDHNFAKEPILVSNRDTIPATAKYRALANIEKNDVTDALKDAAGDFTDQSSWLPGSAAALTAYVIALRENRLVPSEDLAGSGIEGCTVIQNSLAGSSAFSLTSFVSQGVHSVTSVTKEITKIGILRQEDGERVPLLCEFNYLEAGGFNYAVLVTGIRSKVSAGGVVGTSASDLARNLGKAVHEALAGPAPHP
jgi:hypothetical protein